MENNCTPRAVLPTPDKGSLPLPSDWLEKLAPTAFAPTRVEDLNAVVPADGIQLHTPDPHAQVNLAAVLLDCCF